ncbi:fluoride efflux transporter FluC [Xanthobacter sediminis]
MEAIDILWVGIGGGIGSVLRWQVGRAVDRHVASTFKAGTFLINISGAFVIAYLSASLAIGWEHRYGDMVSSLVLTGVLGGYTTFSTMQLDAVQMTAARQGALAAFYLIASVVMGLAAAAAGVALARA